jgi:hypothetical protein
MAIFDGVRAPAGVGAPVLTAVQGYELQAEKRGNFVVISSVEGVRVVSWSLNVCISHSRRC